MGVDYGANRMMTDEHEAPAWTARKLLRSARGGSLATTADGQPFASLVTPACAPDLSPLILISTLSDHTRQLRADPRCALLVTGDAPDANPQTAPRIGLVCVAHPEPDPALKARWLAIHPYAALYADFTDFSLWRLTITAGQFVGGFARAARLTQADLTPDPDAVARLREAEPGILAHCNADHADAMSLLAKPGESAAAGWRMVSADVDGCDLARGEEQAIRVHWSAPVSDSQNVRKELVKLTTAAREALRAGTNLA